MKVYLIDSSNNNKIVVFNNNFIGDKMKLSQEQIEKIKGEISAQFYSIQDDFDSLNLVAYPFPSAYPNSDVLLFVHNESADDADYNFIFDISKNRLCYVKDVEEDIDIDYDDFLAESECGVEDIIFEIKDEEEDEE